jgi:DNA-binding response OmpR family regulator
VHSVLDQLTEVQISAAFSLERLRQLLSSGLTATTIGLTSYPVAEPSTFSIVWSGRTCHLGPTKLYRLFACLVRRPDRYISHDQLLRDVWLGDSRSAQTVRSAMRNLKAKLVRAGMGDLARAIRSRGRHCGLMLDRIA